MAMLEGMGCIDLAGLALTSHPPEALEISGGTITAPTVAELHDP
jgi:hypothetical protein